MRLRGQPAPLRGTDTLSRLCSISVTSAGVAESKWFPKGIPWPSATTIHFVPFPRLVFPTQSPLFWLGQNFHQQRFLPISTGLVYQALREKHAMHQARHHGLPILATCANRLKAKDTTAVNHSTGRHYVIPIKSLQNSGD